MAQEGSFIRMVLKKCKSSKLLKHFEGITDDKFREYTLQDLFNCLPKDPEASKAAAKIHGQLYVEKLLSDINSGGNGFMVADAVREEADEVFGRRRADEESSTVNDSTMVEVTATTSRKEVYEEIVLDSDEDEVGVKSEEDADAEDSYHSDFFESADSDSDGERNQKRKFGQTAKVKKRTNECSIEEATRKAMRNLESVSGITKLTVGSKKSKDPHKCRKISCRLVDRRSWNNFFDNCGGNIQELDVYEWCWRSERHKCSFNLMMILSKCPNLVKLSLFNEAKAESIQPECTIRGQSLMTLKTLTILHCGKMHYEKQLGQILSAAPNLQRFEYLFHDREDANNVLDLLMNRDNRSIVRLAVNSYASSYMKKEQIVKLLQLEVPKLEALGIGHGLWEDVSGDLLEALIKKFATLKELVIPGNYQGNSKESPEISITIPSQLYLGHLDIGGGYKFTSENEDSKSERDEENEEEKPGADDGDDDDGRKILNVTLRFPRILPKLQWLTVGNMYSIEDLHLATFPKLKTFRVGSPWHLTIHWPPDNGKIKAKKLSYPNITSLQLPDGLKDASFVQQIPERFPNLKKCWINLPSVKILRTFFRAVQDMNLEELCLKIQFDFIINLEMSLMDRLEYDSSLEDYKTLAELEKYKKFKEYVQFHNIELPPKNQREINSILNDPSGAGLLALKNGLKLLRLEHCPRALRIPKGNHHWQDPKATFSDKDVGYQCYPLSLQACEVIREKVSWFLWRSTCGTVLNNMKWWGESGFKQYCSESKGDSSDDGQNFLKRPRLSIRSILTQASAVKGETKPGE